MLSVVTLFWPLWILILAGYGLGRSGVLGSHGADVIGRYVFYLAMPAALFTSMRTARLEHGVGVQLASYIVGVVAIAAAAWWGLPLLARAHTQLDAALRIVATMTASYVNSAYLGIPVAMLVVGDNHLNLAIIIVQVTVMMPLILAGLERATRTDVPGIDSGERADGTADAAIGRPTEPVGHRAWRALRGGLVMVLRNPIIGASLAGLAWGSTGLPIPSLIDGPLRTLGESVTATALVTLGASLVGLGATVRAHAPTLAGIVSLKLAAQPALTVAVGWALGIRGHDLLALGVCSGLPTVQNSVVIAGRFGRGVDLSAAAIVATTAGSMLTLPVLTWLLT